MNSAGPYYTPLGIPGAAPRRRFQWVAIAIALVLIAATVLLLVIFLSPSTFGLAGPTPSYRYGLFGGFFLLFFVLLIVFFVVRVAFWGARMGRRRGFGPGGGGQYGPDRPARVARMRYARGEITREQFDQIMDGLSRRPGPP